MLKQILVPALLLGACCIASFMPAPKEQSKVAPVAKTIPHITKYLQKDSVSLSGGGIATVYVAIDSLTNAILDVTMYSGAVPCQRYRVTAYSTGRITSTGGIYSIVSPISITFPDGTATVSGTVKRAVFPKCN